MWRIGLKLHSGLWLDREGCAGASNEEVRETKEHLIGVSTDSLSTGWCSAGCSSFSPEVPTPPPRPSGSFHTMTGAADDVEDASEDSILTSSEDSG